MANVHIAIARSGDVVRGTSPENGGAAYVQFNGETAIPLARAVIDLAIAPAGDRALVRTHNDRILRVTRATRKVEDVDSAFGNYGVGFHPITGAEYWIYSLAKYRIDGVEHDVPKDASGQHIAGQGWTQIVPHGVPRWTDLFGRRTIDGRLMTRCVEIDGWVLGMETADRSWILIVDTRASPHVWHVVWKPKTQQGPCLAIVNGEPWVGIGPPGGVVVRRAHFAPLLEVPPAEPIPEPIFELVTPASCRRHASALDGWERSTGRSHLLAGTVGWSAPPYDARKAYEGMPWARDKSGLWRLVIGTESDVPDEYASKKAQLLATIAEATKRSPRVTVVVYRDDANHEPLAAEMRATIKAAGLVVEDGINAYPRANETATAAETRIERDVIEARAAKRRVVINSAGYTVAPAVRALAPLLHKLIDLKYPKTIEGHVVFGAKRPNADPAVVDYWARVWERISG